MHSVTDSWADQHGSSEIRLESAPALAQPASGRLAAPLPDTDFAAHPCGPTAAPQQSGAGYPLVAIAGPTAAGKSALGLFLAAALSGEVINYDSVQIYRGLDVGSGKVSGQHRLEVPHHLLDVVDLGETMTAGRYRQLALSAVTDIRRRGKLPVLVGGTGLYLRALLEGLFEGPGRSEPLRARLREMEAVHPAYFLHRLLRRLDPSAAQRIHPRDSQKLVRALEVCLLSGRSISALQAQGRPALSGFRAIKIGLNPERAALGERINNRVQWMYASGLLEEARSLLARQESSAASPSGPFTALGYKQACCVSKGEMDVRDAIRDTQAATRRYAKRQLTWFRREAGLTWFSGFGDDSDLQARILDWLRDALATGHANTPS